jgi:DNA-directed RNA polymerase specialized sigma24 family protein
MNEETPEKQVRDFYRRWNKQVFAFCRLFLGDEERGQKAAREAFLAYFRQRLSLASDQLPMDLFRCALGVVRDQCALADPHKAADETLEHAILLLPCEQRAVFILRNVLNVDTVAVADVTRLPVEQVRRLWMESMLAIRELLPRDFFKEHSQ